MALCVEIYIFVAATYTHVWGLNHLGASLAFCDLLRADVFLPVRAGAEPVPLLGKSKVHEWLSYNIVSG